MLFNCIDWSFFFQQPPVAATISTVKKFSCDDVRAPDSDKSRRLLKKGTFETKKEIKSFRCYSSMSFIEMWSSIAKVVAVFTTLSSVVSASTSAKSIVATGGGVVKPGDDLVSPL